MPRRRSLSLSLALLAAWAPALQAQTDFPSQPIRLVVHFTPGGGTDAVSRLIADKVQQTHKGWTLVIDNKPGAGGNIGMDQVAKARGDGHTLGMGQTSTLAQLLAEGSAPMKGSPDEVARYVKAEHARWGVAVKAANLQAN